MAGENKMACKRILIGISGGIAAFKSAELIRLLTKAGHEVQVVLTHGAEAFVTPMTLQAVSGRAVRNTLLDPQAEAGMGHIELARWADLVLVAPASANFLARLAAGMADDLLTTVCCATEAPIVLAPAMNQAMWRNTRTQANVRRLEADPQVRLLGPADGIQACGDSGPGRMLEPEQLMEWLTSGDLLNGGEPLLAGRRVVITAGPTREALDPVRYISNHSSGKMGYALAAAARAAGAEVLLVSGPVSMAAPAGCDRVSVNSAEEMLAATEQAIETGCDLFIATAAVADYRPELAADQKIKKQAEEMTIRLVRNPDILASIAASDNAPFCVGFAAETQDVKHYALDKLVRKKLDMIVANDVSVAGLGFNSDDNAVTVFWQDGEQSLGPDSKHRLAEQLIRLIAGRLPA